MDRSFKTILVTGGAGFIGCNFIHYLFGKAGFEGRVVNLDALTYAGNPESLADIDASLGGKRYFFEKADIRDKDAVAAVFARHSPDAVVHFAAESHVDRSIIGPADFVTTNVLGTFTLLEAAREAWKDRDDVLFHHISTDEVYGSLGETGFFTEETPYDPRSPYSASKAGSDHLVMAYHHTYGLPVTMTNCSNNYGPYQFPEKLIPLMILNMLEGKALPVYGDGKNIRDWLYVEDHARALLTILTRGRVGEKYNVGGRNERRNIDIVKRICEILDRERPGPESREKLITYVTDRPGHDHRYAIDATKLETELGWRAQENFDTGIEKTVSWYLANEWWWRPLREKVYSGERLGLMAGAAQ